MFDVHVELACECFMLKVHAELACESAAYTGVCCIH